MPSSQNGDTSSCPTIPPIDASSSDNDNPGSDDGESAPVAHQTQLDPPATPIRVNQKQLSKTPRRKPIIKYDKMKAPLFHELKRLLSVESVAQFATRDLHQTAQITEASKFYHGEGATVSQIQQFLNGAGRYANLWVVEDTPHGPARILPEKIHQQISKVFVAGENVTMQLLEGSTLKEGGARISGRTIRNNAQACTKGAKKMLTLVDEAVKESILEKQGTEYTYHSGKRESDFIEFILYRMYHWNKFNGKSGDGDDEEAKDGNDDDAVYKGTEQLNASVGHLMEPTDNAEDPTNEMLSDAPPPDYLPMGFVYFMTRGPLVEKEYRSDILSLDLYLSQKGYGRKDSRKAEAKDKTNKRDYDLGSGISGRDSRGMPLGLGNQKEVAMIAQREAQARNQAYDSEIVKLDTLIKGKQGRVNSLMEMARMYREMGQDEKSMERMTNAEEIINEMGTHSTELHSLRSGREDPLEVEEYLKRGRIGMGIKIDAKKNKKRQKRRDEPALERGNEATRKVVNDDGSEEFST